ncbi:MAG: nitroreductase family deazaflavin-dependent oxidoreductase [Acidimicrobiia bacterium]|nr:nitroreductase family deazaflavin-dependent oxidoreductase [Acidimicrobiia bacterium]
MADPQPGRYARLAARIGDRRWFRPVSLFLLPMVDRVLVPLGMRAGPWPTLLLTSTGRVSGKERKTPLFFVETNAGPAVIATNYGRHEPDWSQNLRSDPVCTIMLARQTRPAVARAATPDEGDDLFSRFVAFYPTYVNYRERARRDIPIWILEYTRT